MNGSSTPWVAGVAAVVFGALGTYLAVVRKLSGKIATTDASELWKESAAIRADYRDQLAASAKRIADLEARVAQLERLNNQLERENFACRRAVEQLTHDLATERGQ